jgi:chemotaxis protein CheX
MATEQRIEISPIELTQIVEAVFAAMMDLEVIEWPPIISAERITAAVALRGEWNGIVLVQCAAEQACRFAGHYHSIDTPERVDDVVRDFMGELANRIGGNLQGALHPGLRLSAPSVKEGDGDRIDPAHASVCLAFNTTEGPFGVTVITIQA